MIKTLKNRLAKLEGLDDEIKLSRIVSDWSKTGDDRETHVIKMQAAGYELRDEFGSWLWWYLQDAE